MAFPAVIDSPLSRLRDIASFFDLNSRRSARMDVGAVDVTCFVGQQETSERGERELKRGGQERF